MSKYVFLYYGGKDPSTFSKEEMKEVMQNWTDWFKSIGDKMVDGGNPFKPGKSVGVSEVSDLAKEDWPAKGYTIVEVDDYEQACELAKGCPILSEDDDQAVVRVYECAPM